MQSVDEIVEDFNAVGVNDRLTLLLEYSEALPELPARYKDHPDLLERVEECQSPIFLFVEVDDAKLVHLFFTAPAESPTTRGFASILHSALDGHSVQEVLAVDDDFPSRIGLSAAVSPLRMRGMRGMLARIKRQVAEKSA
ncbi:SufE family protein [Rhodoluna sp. KAS3]|jgi:cysteine desulfuration protein SufE|uniref:SufE family protein n=1 Tax=Rhodoluna sp. KAS3 TaxID=942880 RepID=UPI00222E84F8|nr:SufE family protein [Rhodoluna sp. KAS3]BDS49076.1 cysteine desulfurization protein SufE [Rhodoluna sp. KAS3]